MAIDLTGGLPVEREYVLAECPDEPDFRDAVNVWIEEKDGAFGMRLGVEATSPHWDEQHIWLDIAFPGGRLISLRTDKAAVHPAIDADGRATIRGAGPLAFRCVEPFRQWTATFKGQAAELTATRLIDNPDPPERIFVDVECDIEMTMAAPPWMPGSLRSDAQQALAGEQGQFMSPRYEQLFRAQGELRVGGERWSFTGQGLRIRRTGFRKFEGFSGHSWQSALFPSGKAFGCNVYPPRDDGQPSYNEGFVFDGDGPLRPARVVSAPWLVRLLPGDEAVALVLETAAGEERIEGTSFANIRSRGHAVLPPDFPIVQQAHVHYRWQGEEATGMMERSSKPSVMIL